MAWWGWLALALGLAAGTSLVAGVALLRALAFGINAGIATLDTIGPRVAERPVPSESPALQAPAIARRAASAH
jgi:hypothetical protein